MRTIWKFPLPLEDEFVLTMPTEAEVLFVREQFGKGCLWALVDLDAPTQERVFRTRGTGQDCTGIGRYVGTYLLDQFVWHVWSAPS